MAAQEIREVASLVLKLKGENESLKRDVDVLRNTLKYSEEHSVCIFSASVVV